MKIKVVVVFVLVLFFLSSAAHANKNDNLKEVQDSFKKKSKVDVVVKLKNEVKLKKITPTFGKKRKKIFDLKKKGSCAKKKRR